MGNCGSAPKTEGDIVQAPVPEPVKEESAAKPTEEVKVEQEEGDVGEKQQSLGALLEFIEEKKEEKIENEKKPEFAAEPKAEEKSVNKTESIEVIKTEPKELVSEAAPATVA